jgi:hypothetical protein
LLAKFPLYVTIKKPSIEGFLFPLHTSEAIAAGIRAKLDWSFVKSA